MTSADLVAFTSTGELDTSFGGGTGYMQYAPPAGYLQYAFRSMVLQGPVGNQQLVMVGEVSTSGFNVPGNFSQGVVSRYSLSGVLDTTFGANGYYITGLYGVFAAVTLAPDGSIIVTGAKTISRRAAPRTPPK